MVYAYLTNATPTQWHTATPNICCSCPRDDFFHQFLGRICNSGGTIATISSASMLISKVVEAVQQIEKANNSEKVDEKFMQAKVVAVAPLLTPTQLETLGKENLVAIRKIMRSKETSIVATEQEKCAVRAAVKKGNLAKVFGSRHFKSVTGTTEEVEKVGVFIDGELKHRAWCDFILSDEKYHEKIAEDLLVKDKQIYQTNFQKYKFIQQFADKIKLKFGERYEVKGKENSDPELVKWIKEQVLRLGKSGWIKSDKILGKKVSLVKFFHSIVNEMFNSQLSTMTNTKNIDLIHLVSKEETYGFWSGNRVYKWAVDPMKIISDSGRCPPPRDLKPWAAEWLRQLAKADPIVL